MRAQIIVIDPNTPPEYEKAFREDPAFTVIEAPSSIEKIAGAKSYALFSKTLFSGTTQKRRRALENSVDKPISLSMARASCIMQWLSQIE
jgi:hypothetical protein